MKYEKLLGLDWNNEGHTYYAEDGDWTFFLYRRQHYIGPDTFRLDVRSGASIVATHGDTGIEHITVGGRLVHQESNDDTAELYNRLAGIAISQEEKTQRFLEQKFEERYL